MKLSEITEAYRNATPKERSEFIDLITPDLVRNPIFEEKITIIIEKVLLTSELKPIKRIAELETVTGLTDYSDFEEDHAPTLPEKISILEEKVQSISESTWKPEETEPETTPTIETTKDLKACAVVEYLKTEVKPNDFGVFAIGRKELTTFMQSVITEDLRVKNVSRQLKADIFERAVKLFPNVVYIKKSPSGNKTQSLALKTSSKRTDTYGMTRTAPLGILA